MKGDFSRLTFDKKKHYSAVLTQQGRVQLDADWNEQQLINNYHAETKANDVIGLCGAPKTGGGFKIDVTEGGKDLTISNGRIYVDGILCENEPATFVPIIESFSEDNKAKVKSLVLDNREFKEGQWIEISAKGKTPQQLQIINVDKDKKELMFHKGINSDLKISDSQMRRIFTYKFQPDYPEPPDIDSDGKYLIYLDVWNQHITTLEDPHIREVALGGPDTTTRLKTVWQVKLLNVEDNGDCKKFGLGWKPVETEKKGNLNVRTNSGSGDIRPCLPPSADYRGLENQLYRIEIHKGGDLSKDQVTFKWACDNGSVVTAIESISGKKVIVHDLGPNEIRGFNNSTWVEISDDRNELSEDAGELIQIDTGDRATCEIVLKSDPQTGDEIDKMWHPKLRRWDSEGEIIIEGTEWIKLKGGNGIEIKFSEGNYMKGDYWLIPARTATGKIEWPFDDLEQPLAQSPHGIKHHYCPLALVDFDGSIFTLLQDSDCRQVFPPLTDITAADVKYKNTNCLPELANAKTVQDAVDILCKNSKGCSTFTVTPQKGWEKIFDYIGEGKDAQICFQAGVFKTEEPIIIEKKGNISISGCGAGTQIIASNYESAFKVKDCKEIRISNISVEGGKAGAKNKYEHLNGSVSFEDCTSVVIENAILSCPSGPEQSCTCVTVRNSDSFPDAATGKGLVSIGRCNVVIGQSQSGILIVNAARALVEDNILRHPETAKKAGFDEFAKNKVFRAKAKKLLISDAYIGSEVSASASRNTSVSYGGFKIFFNSDKSVAKSWQDIIDANPPEKVKNTSELLIHAKKIAEKAILDKKFRVTSPLLVSLYNIVSKTELPPAFQGIVVGGKTAKDIRILNNTVIGVLQGIHIGVSHSASATSPPDKAGTVKISGNNIGTHLFSAKNERHGIFVGNCDSLLVESNYINIKRDPRKKIMIDGIRVYGHLGKFMIIRQNHVVDFRTGIFIKPLNVVSTPLWLVQYNMLQNSEKQVDAPNSVKKEQNYA